MELCCLVQDRPLLLASQPLQADGSKWRPPCYQLSVVEHTIDVYHEGRPCSAKFNFSVLLCGQKFLSAHRHRRGRRRREREVTCYGANDRGWRSPRPLRR